jgi:hypothetical protein
MIQLYPTRINAMQITRCLDCLRDTNCQIDLLFRYSATTIPARTAPRPTPIVAMGAAPPLDAALALDEAAAALLDPPLDAASDDALALELAELPEPVVEAEAGEEEGEPLALANVPVGVMLLAPDTQDAVWGRLTLNGLQMLSANWIVSVMKLG